MTIFEHDRIANSTTSSNGDYASKGNAAAHSSSHALVDRLTDGEPYAVAFGGQGSAWLETLEELVSAAGIESDLATLAGEADLLLEPVARELVVVRPIGFEPLRWVRALAAEEPVPTAKQLTSAAVSVPGVLLTQIAAVRALARQGMDLAANPPVAVAGHSQGVLAVEALKAGGSQDVQLLRRSAKMAAPVSPTRSWRTVPVRWRLTVVYSPSVRAWSRRSCTPVVSSCTPVCQERWISPPHRLRRSSCSCWSPCGPLMKPDGEENRFRP